MSVFNGEQYLRQAVESILYQTEQNFEFIIINDGSSDGSAEYLEGYKRADSRIRLVHQSNRGLIESISLGCGLARAQYIARMDADDVALPDRLRHQIEFMNANPGVALLGGGAQFIDPNGKVVATVRPPAKNEYIQEALIDGCVFIHPTTIFRRDVFAALGGYRRVLHAEDYDLWLRFAERSKVANLKDVVLQYRLHPAQVSVRWCHEQALGATAARISALARRAGQADPLSTGIEITAEFIAQLGVPDSVIQTDLARTYLSCVRNMGLIGNYSLALESLHKLSFSKIAHAKRWVIADLHLAEAQLHLHQGKLSRCMLSAGRGVIERPAILGRPIKRLLTFLLAGHLSSPR
jgi:GT2 family glycosyltransferase